MQLQKHGLKSVNIWLNIIVVEKIFCDDIFYERENSFVLLCLIIVLRFFCIRKGWRNFKGRLLDGGKFRF